MKKYIQILVVVALALTLVGIARSDSAWADKLINPAQSNQPAGFSSVDFNIAQPMSIIVTDSGSYLIGGVCQFNVEYKATDLNLKDEVDAEVPIRESMKVPFYGEEHLYYPGCHIVHYKMDEVVDEASLNDGDWQVCFAKRPDVELKIFYYLDNPPGGTKTWNELPTTVEGAYACAPALQTGVYMPAGVIIDLPGGIEGEPTSTPVPPGPGTVRPPAPPPGIYSSGTYGAGGICMLDVLYKVEGLMDQLWEEFYVEDTLFISFPDTEDILFFPGCHVLHFQYSVPQKLMGPEKGSWQICFAAHPDKQMTIYRYESLISHLEPDYEPNISGPWVSLPSTTENGLVCAPADYTGVYVPAGR